MPSNKTKTPMTALRIPGWWPAAARANGTTMTALIKDLKISGDASVAMPGVLDQDRASVPLNIASQSDAERCGHLTVSDLVRSSLAVQYPKICTLEPAPGVVRLVLVDKESKAVRVAWVPLDVAKSKAKVQAYLRKERKLEVHGYAITEAEAPLPGQHFEGIRLSKSAWASKGKGAGK